MVEYTFVHGVLWITAGAVFVRLLYSALLYPVMYTSLTSELLVGMGLSAFAYEQLMAPETMPLWATGISAVAYALVSIVLQRILFPATNAPHFWVSLVAFAGSAAVGQAAIHLGRLWIRRSNFGEKRA